MKHLKPAGTVLALALFIASGLALRADDNVTIPKSKLEELERKAAELEKLQQQLHQAEGQNELLLKQKAAAEARAATEIKAAEQAKADAVRATAAAKSAEESKASAVAAAKTQPAYLAPLMATLPPLKEGDPVSSLDLMSHFLTDPAAAKQRYEQHDMTVEGEIVGFSKPMFVRPYKVELKTGEVTKRVVCTLFPPNRYKAVYTVKNGTQLVGLTKDREAEVPLLKVGQVVVIQGSCRGADEAGVNLSSCELKSVR